MEWPAKEESEVRSYGVNWTARLDGDSISTSAFTVASGTVVIDSDDIDGNNSTCVISGGTNGECAEVLCTITTANGLTYEVSLTLPVRTTDDLAQQASSNTKQQIIDMAYEYIGLPGFVFDASAEEMASAARRLDALMAEWERAGIPLGYSYPVAMGLSDLTDDSGIPDYAVDAVALELAKRIAPSKGKSLSAEAKSAAMSAKRGLVSLHACVPELQFTHGTPKGAGNRHIYGKFFHPTVAVCC